MSAGSRSTQALGTLTNLSGRDEQGKLAAKVASRIVDEVVEQGWPVGEVLGSSDEFLERFDISRAVFREAVRLLEHQGVARTRRGPGGGLVVAEPSIDAIMEAAVLHLHRVDARLDEVLEAQRLLDEIRDAIGPRNPALEVFVEILDRVSLVYERGKASSATRRMTPALAFAAPTGQKRAEGVAREIYRDVVADRAEPGQLLGSEPELTDRYGVSRAVFREAIRLLEHQNVATMRRGPGGGLFVSAPSPAAVADVVAIYLARHGAGIAALAELRVRVEVALVDLVIDRLDAEGSATLEEALEVDEGDERADIAIHNLHASMARLSGNRVLELVNLVLIRLTRFHQNLRLSATETNAIREEVNRVHLGIARAIQAQDRSLARKRVARHLEVLTTHLR